jgi:hypothetical protein
MNLGDDLVSRPAAGHARASAWLSCAKDQLFAYEEFSVIDYRDRMGHERTVG